MRELLLVGAGGFLGAVARYGVGVGMRPWTSTFPWHTLMINVVGCFLIGCLVPIVEHRTHWFLFLVPGVLGGFTTFSSFGHESIALAQGGRGVLAVLYVLASVLAGLGACWGARWMASGPK